MPTFLVAGIYQCLRLPAWLLLRLGCGLLRVSGRHHVPRRGAFILAANHVSFLDPVVVGVACPRRLVFLARAALFAVPGLGSFMRLMRAISIDRHETETGLREAIRLLRAGRPVVLFPEGARQLAGALGVAKPGVGWLAAATRLPIVPVLLEGTRQALPPGARWLRRAKIRVVFGPQIRYANARPSPDACERLAQQVTASWITLAHECHVIKRGT